jgi:hypothetical protein
MFVQKSLKPSAPEETSIPFSPNSYPGPIK